jgi:hypothetical protein
MILSGAKTVVWRHAVRDELAAGCPARAEELLERGFGVSDEVGVVVVAPCAAGVLRRSGSRSAGSRSAGGCSSCVRGAASFRAHNAWSGPCSDVSVSYQP